MALLGIGEWCLVVARKAKIIMSEATCAIGRNEVGCMTQEIKSTGHRTRQKESSHWQQYPALDPVKHVRIPTSTLASLDFDHELPFGVWLADVSNKLRKFTLE